MNIKDLRLTKEQKKLYESWSKDDVYIAYVFADAQYKLKHKEVLRLGEVVAGLEYDIKRLEDDKL